MMIEVFKTNIQKTEEANFLINLLLYHFPETRINIDLADCDKVLRLEGTGICNDSVLEIVKHNGFKCEVLA